MSQGRTYALLVGVCAVAGAAWLEMRPWGTLDRQPISVGILHSLTGTMAISERSVTDATLLAIEELNENGGLLGRRVQPVVADGRSDSPTFARLAQRLIESDKVSVIFGCWTSASRKTIKPIVERLDHLLFYPVQYEGLEQSRNIVYTGAAPNQQIIPAVKWATDHLGRRFFLVGSDYVFPRTANAIIRAQVGALRGEVLGEEYALLGSQDLTPVVAKIVAARPTVILNTLNGDSNVAFFQALRTAGVTPAQVPIVSFSIAENEIAGMDVAAMAGDYAAWNYFQSIDSPENSRFVSRFKARFGGGRVTSDAMEAAYFGVHLWAQAVVDANSEDPRRVRRFLAKQRQAAPEGNVSIDWTNNHTWKMARVGRIRPDGQFDIVWTSDRPIRPVPYPPFRLRSEWDRFLADLYDGWGRRWANPGPETR
jgi:urea transport system substrate-binding protein